MLKSNITKDVLKENVEEEAVKYHILVKDGFLHFAPQHLTVEQTTVQLILPIPRSGAIGTLDKHSNGIVSIKFMGYGEAPEIQIVAKDFSPMVYNRSFIYRLSPNFVDDMIVYSKTRFAVIANIKTGDVFHVDSDIPRNGFILGIGFLDLQNKLFVIVKSVKDGNGLREDYLHIAKLDGQDFVDTGWSMKIGETYYITRDLPLYHTWFVHNRKLFIYADGYLTCTDGVDSISHPFTEIFNYKFSRFGVIKDIMLHPILPFGIMIEERASAGVFHRLVVIRWDTEKLKKQVIVYGDMFVPLAILFDLEVEIDEEDGEEYGGMSLAYQSFSPDGNWYVVGCVAPNASQDPYFIAIPVDATHPGLLDRSNIVVLGQVKGMTSLAWTSDPTSFVVSNGELLYKWDLGELANARVFVMPGEDVGKKRSIFRRIGGLFGKKG